MRIQVLLLGLLTTTLIGCGGSGGSSTGTTPGLTGKPAIRAVTISGYQTQVAADKYVLPLLMAGAPTGANLHVPKTYRPNIGSPKVLGFDSDLNLYYSIGTSGPTWTLSFFTDAAGANSAGFAQVTIEGKATFDTNYLTYPAVLDLSENITAGNLVSSGTGKLTFTDSSGSNTLTGVIDAPGKGIHASLNMSLDSAGHVGGSITVTQNGLTAVVTGLTGALTSSFTGSAAVSPGNQTGTATINLLQGTYELTLSDPSGVTGDGTVDASKNLLITYNDGTTLTLSDPLNQPVTGPGSNGGGTSSYTISNVAGNPASIAAVSADGKMVGQIGVNPNSIPNYWSSPSASPQAITGDSSLTNIVVTGVNASGHMVGSGLDSTTHLAVPLYWSSFNQAPVHLTTPALNLASFEEATLFIQSSDRIIATFNLQGSPFNASYVYSSWTDATPFAVTGGYIIGMSDGTAAVGVDGTGNPVVWPNLAQGVSPILVPVPPAPSAKTALIGADGTISISDHGTNIVWVVAGPSYTTKVALSPPVANEAVSAFGMGPTGQILGTATTDNTSLDNQGLMWPGTASAPVILRTASTPNVITASFETSSGILIVNCVDNPSIPTYRLSILTPNP